MDQAHRVEGDWVPTNETAKATPLPSALGERGV